MECSDSSDCNDHGDCIEEECSCDFGWYEEGCTLSGNELWDEEWQIFIVFFSIIYSLLFFCSTLKLYRTMNPDSFIGIKRLLIRIIASPKNLSLFCLGLVGLLKLIWLLTDPFRFKEKVSRVFDRLLYESVYPLYICVYSSVLLVWGGLFQGMYSTRQGPYKIIKKFVVIVMVGASPLCWALSTVKGLRVEEWLWFEISYILLCIAVAVLTLLYIAFGIILCYYVENHALENDEPEAVNELFEERISSAFEVSRASVKKGSNKIFRCKSESYSVSELDDSENEWGLGKFEFSNEVPEHSWDSFNSQIYLEDQQETVLRIPEVHFETRRKEHSHFILNINREDRIVFRKILILAILSGLLGASVLATFGIFMIQDEEDHETLIQLLFVSNSLEAFAAYMIFIVFTTQIKVEPKERLKFVEKIALSKLNYTPVFKKNNYAHITRRLKLYFS